MTVENAFECAKDTLSNSVSDEHLLMYFEWHRYSKWNASRQDGWKFAARTKRTSPCTIRCKRKCLSCSNAVHVIFGLNYGKLYTSLCPFTNFLFQLSTENTLWGNKGLLIDVIEELRVDEQDEDSVTGNVISGDFDKRF